MGDGYDLPQNPGELTYVLCTWLAAYLEEHDLSYGRISDCRGALEGAKADFIRRIVTPYEERKQRENGDAWPAALIGEVGGR